MNIILRILRYVVLGGLVATVAAMISLLSFNIALRLPGYLAESGPIVAEKCSEIRPGMTRGAVLKLVRETVPPAEERESNERMTFQWADGTCIVEMSAPTETVTQTSVDGTRRPFSWRDF